MMVHPAEGRIFIAYDPQDVREAQDLTARLEQDGFSVWVAGRDAPVSGGKPDYAAVRSAAANAACLLLVLSGRAADMAMLADLTQNADAAGRAILPIRVAPAAQVPNFPALSRAKAWIDACGPTAGAELVRLVGELSGLAQRRATAPNQPSLQPQSTGPEMAAPVAVEPPVTSHPPGPGYSDWSSIEVQPGETALGTWLLALNAYGPDVTGSLTITDRRILFKPRIAGTSLLGMLLSQRKQFKDRHTVVLNRDAIARVHCEKRMISTWITVTTADGTAYGFNRGVMSAAPILEALQPR